MDGKDNYAFENARRASEEASYYVPTGGVPRAPDATVIVKPAGRKDDSGKLDMTLFDDMPHALEAVCEVMQWAITKKQPKPYERSSWLGVSADRYRAAIGRHLSAANKQAINQPTNEYDSGWPARFQRDDETNLLHLAHTACSALFALELTLRELNKKA